MFHPPTYKADTLNFSEEQLNARTQKCLCGNTVRLRDCLVCWTHETGKEDRQWFAVCHPQCVVIHVAEGSC